MKFIELTSNDKKVFVNLDHIIRLTPNKDNSKTYLYFSTSSGSKGELSPNLISVNENYETIVEIIKSLKV